MSHEPLARALAQRLGAEAVRTDTGVCERFAIGSQNPRVVLFPGSETQVAIAIEVCAEFGAAVVPWGAGARQCQLPPPSRYDVALGLNGLNRVIAYRAEDLTLTVEAGCTIDTIARLLRPRRQWLPLDVACPAASTVGGVVASAAMGLDGGGKLSVRDLLLGITAVTGEGIVAHGGGRVVKNVAGYDLMRLLAGSWGTLGVVTQVTWKLTPEPQHRAVGWQPCGALGEGVALAAACAASNPEPTLLAVVQWPETWLSGARIWLLVGLSGAKDEVADGCTVIGQVAPSTQWLSENEAAPLVERVRDFTLIGPAGPWAAGIRLSLLPSDLPEFVDTFAPDIERPEVAVCILPQRGGVYLRRVRRDDAWARRMVALVADFASARRGWAWVDQWPEDSVWEPVALPHVYFSRRVKDAMDPRGILSPGRYWGHW